MTAVLVPVPPLGPRQVSLGLGPRQVSLGLGPRQVSQGLQRGGNLQRNLDRRIDHILNQANDFINDIEVDPDAQNGAGDAASATECSPRTPAWDLAGGENRAADQVSTPGEASEAGGAAGRLPVCAHFLSGRCRLGMYCRLRHVEGSADGSLPNGSPTLARGCSPLSTQQGEIAGDMLSDAPVVLYRWLWLENALGYNNSPQKWSRAEAQLERQLEEAYTSSTPPPQQALFAAGQWRADFVAMTAECLRSGGKHMLQRLRIICRPVWALLSSDQTEAAPMPDSIAEFVEARYLGRPARVGRAASCDDAHRCGVVVHGRPTLIDFNRMEARCPTTGEVRLAVRQPVCVTVACPPSNALGHPLLARRAVLEAAPPSRLLFVHDEDGVIQVIRPDDQQHGEQPCQLRCSDWQQVPSQSCPVCPQKPGVEDTEKRPPPPQNWLSTHLTRWRHECPRGRKCLLDSIHRDSTAGRTTHWTPHWALRATLHNAVCAHLEEGPHELPGSATAREFRGRWDLGLREAFGIRTVEVKRLTWETISAGMAIRMVPSRSQMDGHRVGVISAVSRKEGKAIVRWAAASAGGPSTFLSGPQDKVELREWFEPGRDGEPWGDPRLDGEWDWVMQRAAGGGLGWLCDPAARLSVERLANKTLWVQWRSTRRDIAARNDGDAGELALWCTVAHDEVTGILRHGFDSGRRQTSGMGGWFLLHGGQPAQGALGNGRHFYVRAEDADAHAVANPDTGEKTLMLALVCVGRSQHSTDPKRIAPDMLPTREATACFFYDSTCDAPQQRDASAFVIYDGQQAFPMYVISYPPRRRRSRHRSVQEPAADQATLAVKRPVKRLSSARKSRGRQASGILSPKGQSRASGLTTPRRTRGSGILSPQQRRSSGRSSRRSSGGLLMTPSPVGTAADIVFDPPSPVFQIGPSAAADRNDSVRS
eukprot:TRINITY_DN2798_c0_g1_i1.p1 TRINITY_DN2798_c0_g1~~TRINITY_DN2798_c0_g1_i1.p1  ORF type:complete len:933 (+),score=225.27 TRINITY_DN2798_c0_g1_i1:87-2885(+)